MGHHGANWGPTGANLSQLGAILGPTWGQLDQVGPTWANMRQLGANLGPTWGPLGPTWGNMRPTWSQLGVHLGPIRANLDQLGPTRSQLRPAWTNMSRRGPTWGQFQAIMDEKIIEKPLFFLGFFDTSRKSLKACGDALGEPLGTP